MGNKKGNCRVEYALYKGDEFLDIGTAQQLSEKWGLNQRTISWWACCKRTRELNHNHSGYVVIKLGANDES